MNDGHHDLYLAVRDENWARAAKDKELELRIQDLGRRLAALEALVGASPVESALVTSYPRLSVAQTTGHADDRR